MDTFPPYKRAVNWSRIAREAPFHQPGRTAKSCRERYFNALNPALNQGPWSTDEDDFIVEMQAKHGNKWAAIACMLGTRRTDHSVKNRFNVLKKTRNIADHPRPKRAKKGSPENSTNPSSEANHADTADMLLALASSSHAEVKDGSENSTQGPSRSRKRRMRD